VVGRQPCLWLPIWEYTNGVEIADPSALFENKECFVEKMWNESLL
jgi:hypothetical protein